MSATGGKPAPRSPSVLPVGARCVVAAGDASVTASIASNAVEVSSVVATHDSAMEPGETPAATAAASCELVSWRSGSSAHAWLAGSAGSVDWPPEQSGLVRSASRYGSAARIGAPAAFLMPVVSTAMYERREPSGCVGTIASVRPLVSDGASATTKSCGACSSRTMPVTPPPGPVSVTSNMRTVSPGTSDVASSGMLNVVDQGATGLKPSSALIATLGSPKSVGSADGMLRVRSVLPVSSRLVGNGTTPTAGSKLATG